MQKYTKNSAKQKGTKTEMKFFFIESTKGSLVPNTQGTKSTQRTGLPQGR